VLDTGGPFVAGSAAPNESYHQFRFSQNGANVTLEWGRTGNNVVGRISTDKSVELNLKLSSGWPGWSSTFTGTPDGATGTAQATSGKIDWKLKVSPGPKSSSSSTVTVTITPDVPVRFAAGLDALPDLAGIDVTLKSAQEKYDGSRAKASGDWGDFVGAIADNMNNSRIYSNDNHLLAHSVCRAWADTPNTDPYFCWDSFFTANLAAIDDLQGAQNTVRAMLSYQTPEGLVPNYAKLGGGTSTDRSQPPVGSLCVWKMHQRYLNDADFLKEVYPKLVLWHDWWPKFRNAKGDGLLEWGSASGIFQSAQYETGWDDNLHYAGAAMSDTTMNCYSIDLCSLWSMDAHYLALLADFLGKPDDAARFRNDEKVMNQKINDRLWNDGLNCYCSRFWDDAQYFAPSLDASAFAPGFDAEYFSDENLQTSVAKHHDALVDFNWADHSPIAGVPSGAHWSARWTGSFTAPKTGAYRFSAAADDGVRVVVDGKKIIDYWSVHRALEKTANVSLTQGQTVPVVIEYFQHEYGAELHFSVSELVPPLGGFLTRLTPMNFYALSAGAPDADRAKRTLGVLTDPTKFWGKYLLPTLAYDDPNYHEQEYWRGDVWAPVNYIMWGGIKKYASPPQVAEYADRSVQLFMREWLAKGVCGENYLSTDGTQNHQAHYTWGALLDLIGLESIVDVDDNNQIVLNGAQTKTITLNHIPLLGQIYDVKTSPGSAELIHDGKVVLTAKNTILHATLGK
jgi:putative isomerase